jgi:diketogulonate reductase-like aldo/keto reductase
MPQIGMGTYQMHDGEALTAVQSAVKSGYRLFDTAAMYGNEHGVGEAIRACGVPREQLFIQTKIWNSDQGRDKPLMAFQDSIDRLGLDYVDLYLIHWPMPGVGKYIETWQALEEIYKSGRAKAIGVCNFTIEHLEKLLAHAKVVPAVNQVELHPYLAQSDLREYCKKKGIVVESWGPIGGRGAALLENTTIQNIADKHERTAAQIVLRWHIQQGLVPIPKSIHEDRIEQNIHVFDFELDNDDMAKLSALDTGSRHGPNPDTMNHH